MKVFRLVILDEFFLIRILAHNEKFKKQNQKIIPLPVHSNLPGRVGRDIGKLNNINKTGGKYDEFFFNI
jgi:hypothetical protein